jgi:radical SAM superfamily enzyme YgiQ (UPF0313 family)
MKICLIDPPLTPTQYFTRFARVANVIPSLGLGYLAAVLKKDGFEVEIIDCRVLNIGNERLLQMIKEGNFEIVGISATTVSFYNVSILAEEIKKFLPKVTLILGGPHITALPEETMENSKFDIGIIGEGEYALLELMRQLRDGCFQPDRIEGLIYREGEKLKMSPQRGYIQNLDTLPFPARELYPPLRLYKPVADSYRRLPYAHIMTSRGCPFQCTFCDRKVFGNKFRARSANSVLTEIDELVSNYGVREIKFFDDTFPLNKERALLICEGIIKRKLNIIWSCLSHTRHVDKELLTAMKRAGCWQVTLGLESGDPKVLASMKKGITLEDSRNAVRRAKKAGLNVKAFFIIGMPEDTMDSIKRTLEFAKSLPIDTATFLTLTLFPGTELFNIAVKEGTLRHKNWQYYSQLNLPDSNITYIPKKMTRSELRQISSVIHKKFYFRPKQIFRQLKQLRSLNDIKRSFNGLTAILFQK